jgi:phage terminase large subunit-like protein
LRLVRGSTFENKDLDEQTLDDYRQTYEGSPTGQMELYGEIPLVPEGALWAQDTIDRFRVSGIKEQLPRVVVGLDPSIQPEGQRDEAGIVVAGRDANGHVYVLEDGTVQGAPLKWSTKAASLSLKYHASDVIFEQNNVSEELAAVIRQVEGQTKTKWEPRTAKAPKDVRAAPVALMYEAGMVHHVGQFDDLEIQLTTWDPRDKRAPSPNRLDALVWAVTELSPSKSKRPLAIA